MKSFNRWHSERVGEEVSVVRWGYFGTPVIVFPTAGGDAEEIERHYVIDVLRPLLEAGRIKVYSCDSVAGRALLRGDGSTEHRSWIQNQFQEFIYHEMVPAIRADCRDPGAEVVVTGPSIGAFTSLAVLCRYPHVFKLAICMSGTFNMLRFLGTDRINEDFQFSSPLHFLPNLNGPHLEALRKRFVILASGEGAYEDIGESWNAAHVLGSKGIPNRVDSWGQQWEHDWVTWRAMLPHYLGQLD